MSQDRSDALDRAAGSLWGLALGDALGMPTQLLSPDEIEATLGAIEWFVAAAPDHPVAAGLPAGSVTDDTEQALLLAGLLGSDPFLDQEVWARALMAWEDAAIARGSHDLLGPSTKAALDALRRGAATVDSGGEGTTNGAAMRICPVGLAVGPADPAALVDRVVEASRLTHDTSVALSGAAAVAGAVSSAIEGADVVEAIRYAVRVADLASRQGRWRAGASVGRRIEWAVLRAPGMEPTTLRDFVSEVVGTSLATQESVPAAFALVSAFADDPWGAACCAAGLGGDTDTIAAIAGAVLGAVHGMAGWPMDAVALVAEVNGLDLEPVAARLLEIRHGRR